MTKVYGGLLLENLPRKDEQFELQCQLWSQGLIQGVQILVRHPSLTPGITSDLLPSILAAWPGEIFIHCGAESVGVDFGQRWDEAEIFMQHGGSRTWDEWNIETLLWALGVADAARGKIPSYPACVVHPGYGKDCSDEHALVAITDSLFPSRQMIVLENVPPLAMDDPKRTDGWDHWGFGGTPDDMALLLEMMGPDAKCLIDFTHAMVLANQAKHFPRHPQVGQWRDLDTTLEAFLALPHSPVCHWSGVPSSRGLTDEDCELLSSVLPPNPLRKAIESMEVVCLEVPFHHQNLEEAKQEVGWFREKYLV